MHICDVGGKCPALKEKGDSDQGIQSLLSVGGERMGFNGKLGTAVGSKWKGINVIRSRPPRKRRGQPTESQLEVQAKFTLMTNFLRPLAVRKEGLHITQNGKIITVWK